MNLDHLDRWAASRGFVLSPWLKTLLEPLMPLFKEVLAMSLFINLLAVAVPVFVLQVYDRVIFHTGLSTLQGLVIGVLVVIGFDFSLRQARARALQTVALKIDVAVSQRLLDKLLTLPLRVLETRAAALWQMLFRDADVIRNTLSGATAVLAMDLVFAAVFLALVAVIALPVFWVLLVFLAIFVALAWRAGDAVAKATDREKAKIVVRDALVSELIIGRTTVKALSLDARMRVRWQDRQAEAIGEGLRRGQRTDVYVYSGQSLTLLATVAMTTIGALAIMNQSLTMGGLIAANMLSGRLLGPLNQLVGAWRSFSLFEQSSDRLGRLFAEAEEPAASAVQLARPQGRVTLDDVTFRYGEDAAPTVEGIKLDIAPHSLTAVMGPNGSGKTTLVKIILGLYKPDRGRMLIDGADLAQFARTDISRWIGYVPQDCVLFQGTIRDNIAAANPDASDEEVVRAATVARVHNAIIDMPQGYGTPVGEGGARLSGGMRQRIAIARGVLGAPPVLVMDEPTSNLDRAAEDELRQSLIELSREHTIILVTHSPALLQGCHNVVVMERGHIKAAGPTLKTLQSLGLVKNDPPEAPSSPIRVVVGGASEASVAKPA